MMTSKSYVERQLCNHQKVMKETAILLGSANLPFPEVYSIRDYILDFNAAEGQRYNRLFPGCNELDNIEEYGELILKKLFRISDCFQVSFDPLSGTQANQIVYNAILKPNSTILSLSLNSGGHPSHLNYLKKYYNLIEYHYNFKTHTIDYDEIRYLCKLYHPDMIIAGTSSYPLSVRYDILGEICKEYHILLLADISHTALYIMEKYHSSPFDFADFVTFTTHKTTRGPRGAILVYNKKYYNEISSSIFPVSQGAPIFSQICAKVIMLEALYNYERKQYCERIFHLSKLFIQKMEDNLIPMWINDTETHLCIIDLSNYPIKATELQYEFEQNGIFVNTCLLPTDDNAPNGIRFGFMMLATLNISDNDFLQLVDIIINIINQSSISAKKRVQEIITPYFNLILEEYNE